MTVSEVTQNAAAVQLPATPDAFLRETSTGYDVQTFSSTKDRAVLIERISAIAGFTLIALALTEMFLTQNHALTSSGGLTLATGATALTGGVAFIWIAIRGIRYQINFDLEQRQMRHVVYNHMGGRRILRTVGFDEIRSAYIKRKAGPGKHATLFVRIGDGNDLIEVARGGEATLRDIHIRLAQDLPAQKQPSRPQAQRQRPANVQYLASGRLIREGTQPMPSHAPGTAALSSQT